MRVLRATGAITDIGDLAVGDKMASPDGMASSVLAILPSEPAPSIRIMFRDGRSVTTSACHVWNVSCKYWSDGRRLMTSGAILRWHQKATRYGRTMRIERHHGEFGTANPHLPPYLLGVLIGDGGLTTSTPTFTSMDPEIVSAVQEALPHDHYLHDCKDANSGNAKTYAVAACHGAPNLITRGLRQYGLMGKTSLQKQLPEAVFNWSRPNRLELLRGLMDTDGYAGKDNCAT